MTLAESTAEISTQYYKIACLQLVTYSIFIPKEPSPDQVLLELELQVRQDHPRILLTYNNKCLYYFRFNHWMAHNNVENPHSETAGGGGNDPNLKLDHLYPQLVLKIENTVPVEKLANPSQGSRTKSSNLVKEETQRDEYLAYASLSFMKAVKKSLLYNLSALGQMQLFGNNVVARVSETSSQFRVVQIDPVLLPCGDLLALITQRDILPLFHSSVLNLDHVIPEFASCFAIYVTPSGLRCHLYDSQNLSQNFTNTPPKSGSNLLRLLKLSTGIDFTTKPQMLWVKLLPNLQHLNNQTSNISRFIHDVENKKYILWPWELCVLQFGSVEKSDPDRSDVSHVDPISLINDYMAFSLCLSDVHSPEKSSFVKSEANGSSKSTNPDSSVSGLGVGSDSVAFPVSVPSVASARNSFGDSTHAPSLIRKPSMSDIFSLQHGMMDAPIEVFDVDDHEESPQAPKAQAKDEANKEDETIQKTDGEEDDDSDLFGESSDLETKESLPKGPLDDVEQNEHESVENETDEQSRLDNGLNLHANPEKVLFSASQEPKSLASGQNGEYSMSELSDATIYTGIPKSEMISVSNILTTPESYNDPGAPPAIMPTPAIPQANFLAFNSLTLYSPLNAQQGNQSQPLSKVATPFSWRDRRLLEPATAWAFSPIAFNPKIKSSIDAKYGKGGKFYVTKEESSGPDSESRNSHLGEKKNRAFESVFQPDISNSRMQNKEAHSSHLLVMETKSRNQPASVGPASMGEEFQLSHTYDGTVSYGRDDDKMVCEGSEQGIEDDEDEDEDEDEIEDEDESDEDEDQQHLNESTLRLSAHSGDILNSMKDEKLPPNARKGGSVAHDFQNSHADSISNLVSPGPIQTTKSTKHNNTYSPFGLGIDSLNFSMSPMSGPGATTELVPTVVADMSSLTNSQVLNKELTTAESSNTPTSTISASSAISESSNCFPLILRSINIHTIPNLFLLNKVPGAWGEVSMDRNFDMDADEEEDDIDQKDQGPFVKLKHIDEFLGCLVPNLTFDSGLTNLEKNTQLKLPDFYSETVITNVTDGSASKSTATAFTAIFPSSYNVTLHELLTKTTVSASDSIQKQNSALKSDIAFLEEVPLSINTDYGEFASTVKKDALKFWDAFYPISLENSECQPKVEPSGNHYYDDSLVFCFDTSKAKVLKNHTENINLNSLGTRFWKYFGFTPVHGPKMFQVVMISEAQSPRSSTANLTGSADFLNQIIYNYADMRLGDIKRLHLQKVETRPDLDGISQGVLTIEKSRSEGSHGDWYKKANRRLKNLAELIKLDIINRTNKFEFDRPLLLLFVDFDESIHSILHISKLFRNFKVNLQNHQLSLVNVFAHVIPASYIYKKNSDGVCLRYLSDAKLGRLSTILYNKCPGLTQSDKKSLIHDDDEPQKLFSHLVKDSPTSLHFKFFNTIKDAFNKESYDDMFLHVAYERSTDKNWLSVAWSDPLGIVTHVRAWYCPQTTVDNHDKRAHDLGSVINKIWEISNKLFKKLNEDILQRTCGYGKKKFLVLSRVSSIIPDDELLFWKRLTAKHKEVSLIVLTTNRTPKYLFGYTGKNQASSSKVLEEDATLDFPFDRKVNENLEDDGQKSQGTDFMLSLDVFPIGQQTVSPGYAPMSASPMNNTLSFHSPQQFPNVPSNMFLSLGYRMDDASDDSDCTILDPTFDILGITPRIALPSCNSPTRHSMRTGYLVKPSEHLANVRDKKYIAFEVSLLSCSNYWNLDTIMKIILKQLKKLVVLNDILGVTGRTTTLDTSSLDYQRKELQTLVPWHINAVVKTLDYLSHVHVEE